MTRRDDLVALRDRVRGGEATTMGFDDAGFDGWAELAYFGSLDAAKALHEALLPGWGWQVEVSHHRTEVQLWKGNRSALVDAPIDPARTWLLCILDALIEGEG